MKLKDLFAKVEEIETIAREARKDPDREVYLEQIKKISRKIHNELCIQFPKGESMDKELDVK
ncbi:hypothetical protein KGY79_13445 [Candidatus Bipolaricaulota bacterium]|nr:hypothetical protein [Candidatus Bipolaricaulota bacterium]